MEKENIRNNDLEKLFSSYCGKKIHTYRYLSSHGSDRIIIRIKSHEKYSAIGIINQNVKENKAFIAFAGHFRKNGINVPEIYGASKDYLCYLTEDLGDRTLFEEIKKIRRSFTKNDFEKKLTRYYEKAINELLQFQIISGKNVPYRYCYQYGEFGVKSIEFDLNYFKERFLKNFYSKKINHKKLGGDLLFLKTKLLELPRKYFLYRDFQSRNIMIKKGILYFIDFQSGRKGALQYDLASLLFDARANIPQNIREHLLEFYIRQAKKIIPLNELKFKEYFWYFAVVRILQAMGAYGYLGITKGKKKFLESIPYAVKNINMILSDKIQPGALEYLKEIFTNLKK